MCLPSLLNAQAMVKSPTEEMRTDVMERGERKAPQANLASAILSFWVNEVWVDLSATFSAMSSHRS